MTSPPPRRPSFGKLLRRTKSGDFGKSGKRAQAVKDAELERQRQSPPKLPEFGNNTNDQLSKSFSPELQSSPAYNLSTGPAARPSRDAPRTLAAGNYPPVPPVPFDPYARAESMTHRGRYSYASSAVSTVTGPRKIRRRKDPTPFKYVNIGASFSCSLSTDFVVASSSWALAARARRRFSSS